MDAGIRQINTGILQSMQKMGEESVRLARENADKIDATGKLANSIGYIIVSDGQIIAKEFKQSSVSPAQPVDEPANVKRDMVDEVRAGETYADSLAALYPKGFALIVVSGSEYAVQAESLSQDVLTSAEMYVGRKLPQLLEKLGKQ